MLYLQANKYLQRSGTAYQSHRTRRLIFSKVGEKRTYDYAVAFSETQKVRLQRKILRAGAVVGSALEITQVCINDR